MWIYSSTRSLSLKIATEQISSSISIAKRIIKLRITANLFHIVLNVMSTTCLEIAENHRRILPNALIAKDRTELPKKNIFIEM